MKGDRIFTKTLNEVRQLALIDSPAVSEEKPNGRDPELVEARNVHIMYRYHYYCTFTDKRWDVVLGLLSGEFYLSEVTLNKIIQENSVLRRRIMNEAPSIAAMKKKYGVEW